VDICRWSMLSPQVLCHSSYWPSRMITVTYAPPAPMERNGCFQYRRPFFGGSPGRSVFSAWFFCSYSDTGGHAFLLVQPHAMQMTVMTMDRYFIQCSRDRPVWVPTEDGRASETCHRQRRATGTSLRFYRARRAGSIGDSGISGLRAGPAGAPLPPQKNLTFAMIRYIILWTFVSYGSATGKAGNCGRDRS